MTEEEEAISIPAPTVTIGFRATPELARKLRVIAYREETSASAIMRQAVLRFIEEWEETEGHGQLSLFDKK